MEPMTAASCTAGHTSPYGNQAQRLAQRRWRTAGTEPRESQRPNACTSIQYLGFLPLELSPRALKIWCTCLGRQQALRCGE